MDWKAICLGLALLLSVPMAQARVFSFKTHTFAAYVKGTAGLQESGAIGFGNSSGDATRFDDEVDYNFGGEFGLVWNLSESLALRIGAEVVQTKNIDVDGDNAAGTKLMDLKSSVRSFNPLLNIEYIIGQIGNFRTLVYGGVGYSQMTVTNEYIISGTGSAQYPSADSEYKEVVKGENLSYNLGVGMEFLVVDNVTMLLDAGYRMNEVTELTHSDTVNTVNGTRTKGSKALKNGGAARSANLDGAYVGLTFRFYIPPISF